jgi:hypothetical protein
MHIGSVHPAYNPAFSACFFSWNSIFLSQQISQQCFSAGLSDSIANGWPACVNRHIAYEESCNKKIT